MLTRLSMVLVSLLLLTALAACGGDDEAFQGISGISDHRDMPAVDVDEDVAAEPGAESYDGQSAAAVPIAAFDRRVIRSGEMVLDVTDIDRAVRHARDVAEEYGGHVATSSARTFADNEQSAELTLEVPSVEFDSVMEELRNATHVARIEHESTSSRDVTEEYVDLRARLTNLEATEQRFVRLLDDARTIDDILRVERELSRVRGEIEQIQGRLNYLEQRTDFSRIHVEFRPASDPITVVGWEFTPGESAREAWNSSMQFLGTLAHGVILVGVFFWWAWPLLIIAFAALWRYQRRRRVITTESPA
jgi:hypothetical protein